MGRQRSFPTIDVSPSDSDIEIVTNRSPMPPVPPPVSKKKGDGPSMAAFLLTRTTAERKFWSRSEETRTNLENDVEDPELPRPRRTGRSFFSKLLFSTIALAVLTLIACEISIAFKVPWLDPRPALSNVKRVAAEKVARLRGR
jgi:hypothetical protein